MKALMLAAAVFGMTALADTSTAEATHWYRGGYSSYYQPYGGVYYQQYRPAFRSYSYAPSYGYRSYYQPYNYNFNYNYGYRPYGSYYRGSSFGFSYGRGFRGRRGFSFSYFR